MVQFYVFVKLNVHTGSSDEVMETCGGDGVNDTNGTGREKAAGAAQRSNTTVHVCWHRNTSISMRDQLRAVEVSILYSYFSRHNFVVVYHVWLNTCLIHSLVFY